MSSPATSRRLRTLRRQLCASPASGFTYAAAPADATYAASPPCYFPSSAPLSVPVLAVTRASRNASVITFGLPDGVSLNLPVSSCLMLVARGAGEGGKDAMRPYNPISANTTTGSFQLLIKHYADGVVSKYAAALRPGDEVGFRQLGGNVKAWRYPFAGVRRITMVAGGTGITPMYQALLPLLATPGDRTQVRLLYGNATEGDILLRREIDALAAAHPDRFTATYVVGGSAAAGAAGAADGSGWGGEVGWIDADKIKRFAFPPAADSMVWVCGQPGMYEDLCGSRGKALKAGTVLPRLGYTDDMVWRS